MEIELPDGTILDAPDDIDPKVSVQAYLRVKDEADFQEKNAANVKDQSFLQNLRQGTGMGMVKAVRHMGNLMTFPEDTPTMIRGMGKVTIPKTDPKNFFSDESIAEQKHLDQALEDTGGGTIGDIIGQTAATLPLTAGASAPLQAVSRGTQALPLLSRALGSAPLRAAVEGSVGGAVMADRGEKGEAAGQSAIAAAILDRLFKGGGRLLRGLVQKSDAAKDLIQLAAQHGEELDLPIAAAASENDIISRLTKTLYKEGLPNVPGTGGKLARQTEEAMEKVRELALKEATPANVTLPKGIGADVAQAKGPIKGGFDAEYDRTVKSLDFLVPKNFRNTVAGVIKSKVANVDNVSLNRAATQADQLLARYSSGKGRIEGENLLDMKNELSRLIKQSVGKEKQALIAASSEIERMIEVRLKPQGLWDAYVQLSEPYANFKALSKAIKAAKAKGGNFTPAQLARTAPEGSALEVLGQTANATLGQAAPRSSIAGKVLTGAMLGGYGFFVDPLTALGALGGSQILSTKTIQRALMGETTAQKRLVEALRRHPALKEQLERATRTALTTQIGDEYGSD